jgi:hypothetical protein
MTCVSLYVYLITKAMPAIFVWFLVYVFKHVLFMTVFHIYGSMEIIKNANLALGNQGKAKRISEKGAGSFSVHSLAAG